MHFNNTIPPEKENLWVAFLNGEPEISDVSNLEPEEKAEFTAAWEAAGNSFSYSSAHLDQTWLKLQKEITISDNHLKFKIVKSPFLKLAAMIVIVMVLSFTAYQLVRTHEKLLDVPVVVAVVESDTHPVNITTITLPDGSTVKMNASTRIEYPERFLANVRKVKLSGEAFFEVTRDTLRPFVIETDNASVEVLGTSFNVSAYPMSGLIEVNVESGKVRLTQRGEGKLVNKSAILPSGERGWLNVADGEIFHNEPLAPNYSSWITKEIHFQRTPLSEAFSLLENIYHVKIKMENSDIGKIPYTANFANLKLDYIVDIIARTHKLNVKRSGEDIIFTRKTNFVFE